LYKKLNESTRVKSSLEPERQRYSIRTAVKELKAKISPEDYLSARGVEVRRNRARCIVHGGDNPHSFSIEPEKQLWHCFACGHGGDLIDLCELTEKHADTWTAVVSLSLEFGVELPRRPEPWHRRQSDKAEIREEVRRGLAKTYQRRFYRMFHDPGADLEDDMALWEAMYKPAYLAATKRVFT